MRRRRLGLVVRRRAWLVVLVTALVGAAVFGLARLERETYEATRVLYVPTIADEVDPLDAFEAQILAGAYAEIITEDDALRITVARAAGTTLDDVDDRLSVVQVGDTALVEIRFGGAATADEAIGAMRALVAQLEAGTSTIPAGHLVEVEGDAGAEVSRRYFDDAQLLGVALGLVLGLGIAFLIERSDRRADDAGSVTDATGIPAFDLDHATDGSAELLVQRWITTHPEHQLVTAAFVPVPPRGRELAHRTATRFAELGGDDVGIDGVEDDPDAKRSLLLVPVDVVGRDGAAELTASVSDLAVLVVPRGTRTAHLEAAASALARLGRGPEWCLVVGRARR